MNDAQQSCIFMFTSKTYFTGIDNYQDPKTTLFTNPLQCTGIRIKPTNWQSDIALRVEVLSRTSRANATKMTCVASNMNTIATLMAENVYMGFACYLWDLGDGHTVAYGAEFCKRLWPNVATVNEYASDTLTFSYTYSSFGKYSIQLQEITGFSRSSYNTTLYLNSYGCTPYTLIIGGETANKPKTQFLKVPEQLDVMATLNMSCLLKYENIQYIWSITNQQNGNIRAINANNNSLQHFDPFYFTQGTFLIQVTVNLQPLGLQNLLDNMTLIVDATPLQMQITGGDTRTVGNGADVQIDASLSYDPDDPSQSNSGITFKWRCTKVSYDNKLTICTYVDLGAGIISIPQSELQTNSVLQVEVTATKNIRVANKTQVIHVIEGNPLDIYISEHVTTTEPLVLSVECVNCNDDAVSYQWELMSRNNIVSNFAAMTSTGTEDGGLVVLEDMLEIGEEYQIRVRVGTASRAAAEATYAFSTSIPQSNGTCTCNPESGFAAVTLFQLSCSGWTSESESRQQLTYTFKAVLNHTEFLLSSSQLSQTPSLLLPVGDLDTQGTLDLRASVCNSAAACASAPIHVLAVDDTVLHNLLVPVVLVDGDLINNLIKFVIAIGLRRTTGNKILHCSGPGVRRRRRSQVVAGHLVVGREQLFAERPPLHNVNEGAGGRDAHAQKTINFIVVINGVADVAEQNAEQRPLLHMGSNCRRLDRLIDRSKGGFTVIAMTDEVLHCHRSDKAPTPIISWKRAMIMSNGTRFLMASSPMSNIERHLVGEAWCVGSLLASLAISASRRIVSSMDFDAPDLVSIQCTVTIQNPFRLRFDHSSMVSEMATSRLEKNAPMMGSMMALELFLGNPQAFPGRLSDIVLPACPGPATGSSTCCPIEFQGESIRGHPYQVPETPQLATLDLEKQRVDCEALPNCRAPHPITDRNETAGNATNVKVRIWTTACKVWDDVNGQWNYDLAQVHPNSTMDSTVCVVGGGHKATTTNAGRERVFVAAEVLAPNTIDFSTVFTKFDLVSNGAVFAAVIVIILLYVIMLLWARKADIKDNKKNRMFFLFDVDDENQCLLVLRVATAKRQDAGTRCGVCFTLYFKEFDTGIRELAHPEIKEFKRDSIYNFLFSVPKNYGYPLDVKLWLKDADSFDCLFVSEISVLDLEKQQVHFFCVNSMESSDTIIGHYGKIFQVKNDHFSFNNSWMVHEALKGNFSEGHLWFSVFFRPFKTNFSRVQRISCCVTLLFLMMIANAMWFGKKQAANEAGGGVTVGPLSLTDIFISLLSSLVEVPVSLVVVLIFRNSRSESERPPGQKSSWRGPWPGGCRFVGWCLIVLTVLSSGFFTILYSMEWGSEKANRWLVRFLFSFVLSVILIQPMKNIVFAVGRVLMWKKNEKYQADEILKPYTESYEIMDSAGKEKLQTSNVQEKSSSIPRKGASESKRQTCLKPTHVLRALYLVALLLAECLIIGDYTKSLKTNVEKTFIVGKFGKVTDAQSYWDWVSNSLLPYMKQTGSSATTSEAPGNEMNRFHLCIVGLVRLQQLRYTKGSSKLNFVAMLKNGQYTPPEEDTNNYSKAWVMSNSTGGTERDQYWIFKDMGEEIISMNGERQGRGGYLVEAANDAVKAADTVAYLRENSWVDPRTAALVTEVSVLNANTKLLCHLTLLLIFSSPGVAKPQVNARVFSILEIGELQFNLNLTAYVSIFVLNLLLLACDVPKICKEKGAYFKKVTHLVEFLCFGLRITTAVAYYQQTMTLKETLETYTQDGNVTFGKLASLDERLRVALALLVFVESLKALQLPLLHRGARRCLTLPLLHREAGVKSRLLMVALLLTLLLCAYSLSLHGLYGAHSWAHAFQSVTSALVRMSHLGEALGGGGPCATLAYLSFRLMAFLLLYLLSK
ncbi:polycystin-1-like protein 2 [Lampetra fluviatilis]